MDLTIYATFLKDQQIKRSETEMTLSHDTDGVENEVVNLYPEVEYQRIEGFGGAMTEAAAYAMSKLPEDQKKEILDTYFGPGGIGYRFLRTHIDSCDFSLGNYSAMNDATDEQMKSFSLARDEELVIPAIRQAIDVCEDRIGVMLTPWSPPPFMKTNGQKNGGGSLKKEYYPLWAAYICRYILEYRQRGLNVTMLSIQNEPKAVQPWDSCVFTAAEEREFLKDHLWPSLQKNGLSDVQLLIWDHNKERVYERACEIIDEETQHIVSGVAFHWYSGDHFEALRLVSEEFPDKKLVFTEGCVELSHYSDASELSKARRYAHDIIGDLNNGMNLFIDWNIALDEQGGPNHVHNYCDAPISCDTKAGTYQKRLTFDYIGHFSKHIKLGARRIAYTKYADTLEITAAKNPDGSIAVVIMNTLAKPQNSILRLAGKTARIALEGDSITTVLLTK